MGAWFEEVTDDQIQQGQVIFDYEVFVPIAGEKIESKDGIDLIPSEAKRCHLLVLTHSCDLERRTDIDGSLSPPKTQGLLLTPLYLPDHLQNHPKYAEVFRSSTYLHSIREGAIQNFCMLGSLDSDIISWPFGVVNFLEIYHENYANLQTCIAENGHRVRLAVPYREYLSQAFAKSYMRVAIDEPITIEVEGKDSRSKERAMKYLISLTPEERQNLLAGLDG